MTEFFYDDPASESQSIYFAPVSLLWMFDVYVLCFMFYVSASVVFPPPHFACMGSSLSDTRSTNYLRRTLTTR
jgi:hypothetical protein